MEGNFNSIPADVIDESFSKYVLRSKIEEMSSKMKFHEGIQQTDIKLNNYIQSKQIIRGADWSMNYKWRASLWLDLCRHLNKESFITQDFYDECCAQIPDGGQNVSLPMFIDRKHIYSYNLSEEGCNACLKVLNVIQVNHPAITYAPTLYPICCLLAHYVANEADLYSCIDALITCRKGKFVTQTKLRLDASIGVIIQLLKRHSRASYIYIKKLAKDADILKLLFRNWIWWIYRDLPFSYLIRVLDCYLTEGHKVLYRIGMALIILFHKYSGRYSTAVASALKNNDINSAISDFVSRLPITEEKLLKVAFKIRNLKSAEISALELEHEMIVKSENLPSPSTNSAKSYNMSYPSRGAHKDMTASNSVLSFELASSSLTVKELVNIRSWLPPRITTMQPEVVYSTSQHGSSLISFFMLAEKYEPTVLVVKTTNKEIIGAYCSGSWMERNEKDEIGNQKRYFATGESFLFTLAPKVHKFPWIGIKDPQSLSHSKNLFMMANETGIAIGGGGSDGLWLDNELMTGKTGRCDTFDNPSLISASHDDFSNDSTTTFTCAAVEVIGFKPT